MIRWSEEESGEGKFESKFFQNEDGNELYVYTPGDSEELMECAEKCVEAFNSLSEDAVNEICEKLIDCAKEGGLDEEFSLPRLDSSRDILNYCWFVALYVDMADVNDDICYAVEGEGEWGENIGFYINGGNVVYVGTNYLDYTKNG